MRKEVYVGILMLVITLSSILTVSYSTDSTSNTNGNSVPRNIYPINVENNTANNPLLSAYLSKLLKDLEDIKLIVGKYNPSLSEKVDKLERLIIKGDYRRASILYNAIKGDLKKLLEELKDVNPEDYLKLRDLLPEKLDLYGNYDLTDMWNSIGGGNLTTELEYPGNMNISIANNFFNPRIKPVSLPMITAPSIESPYLMDIFILILISLLGVALITKREGLYPVLSSIKARIKLGKTVSFQGAAESRDYITLKYHQFLNIMRKLGFPRRESEGPLEYSNKIKDDILRRLAGEMGYYFEKVRYGLKELSKDELDRVNEIINSLEARIK